MYSNEKNVYSFTKIDDFLTDVANDIQECKFVGNKVKYLNVPIAFDIESTSFYEDEAGRAISIEEKDNIISQLPEEERDKELKKMKKVAIMYIWQFGINGIVIYGREWWEFQELLNRIAELLKVTKNNRIIIYVHNLSYEYQFIRKYFNFTDVLNVKERKPVYALCNNGIEFRCSYLLSAYNLKYVGDNLIRKYQIKKLAGDLDYNLMRGSQTPLTQSELGYCINDVRVVMSYIQEKIENEDGINNIPLTNTGYVRRYCRDTIFNSAEGANYREIIKSLKISDKNEYLQLKDGFMGGFTHAAVKYVGSVVPEVGSIDVTSDYPYQMIGKYFPMSKSVYIGNVESKTKFKYLLNNFCCLFDVEFQNIEPIFEYENIISVSRCHEISGEVINNGRVVSAKQLSTTLTELDFKNITYFYKWEKMRVINMRIYKRGYLPTPFVYAILGLYAKKTELKGIEGKETEFMVSKNMANASYGMIVTDIIRDDVTAITMDDVLNKYNKGFNRFLYYPWGVWVTAHARDTLFDAILEFGPDYVYSDTDSIKAINMDIHGKWLERANHQIRMNLYNVSKVHNIPYKMFNPKNKKGEIKTIGLWDVEHGYELFKANGAKRYMYVQDGNINMTVAGLNKKVAMPYLKEKFNNDFMKIFDNFKNGMYIPKDYSGKLTHSYIDTPKDGVLVDYLGIKNRYHQKTSIHLEKQDFTMSLLLDYVQYLNGIQLQFK